MIADLAQNLTRRINKPAHFLSFYDKVFAPYRELPIRLLEIGIDGGGSLELWRKYFPKAEIVGLDIEPKPSIDGVKIVRGDQLDAPLLESLGRFDIIIDDGGHKMTEQQGSFDILFPTVKSGGIYVIEDLETSHLGHYSGHRDSQRTTLDYLRDKAVLACKGDREIASMTFIKDLVAIERA